MPYSLPPAHCLLCLSQVLHSCCKPGSGWQVSEKKQGFVFFCFPSLNCSPTFHVVFVRRRNHPSPSLVFGHTPPFNTRKSCKAHSFIDAILTLVSLWTRKLHAFFETGPEKFSLYKFLGSIMNFPGMYLARVFVEHFTAFVCNLSPTRWIFSLLRTCLRTCPCYVMCCILPSRGCLFLTARCELCPFPGTHGIAQCTDIRSLCSDRCPNGSVSPSKAVCQSAGLKSVPSFGACDSLSLSLLTFFGH